MARYRRRRRRRWVRPSLLAVSAFALGFGAWWLYLRPETSTDEDEKTALDLQPSLPTDWPEIVPASDLRPDPGAPGPEKGAAPESATPNESTDLRERAQSLIAAGKQALERRDLIAARTYFSQALQLGVEEPDLSLLRAELMRIGGETIFSSRTLQNDPFVERYVIQPGDTLGKIARANHLSANFLADINQIRDKNRIRAGQTIKVVKGPFHVVIDKSAYSLDVYLGTTFVKHFKVGLGADDSTPSGKWRVGTKLENPTYYPPRGGQIIAADDPENPLGERWIGLAGLSGEATGQLRYGIHGTIEPDTIGQSISLGCIRMYNEDVEVLYTYLVEKHSTVTVLD